MKRLSPAILALLLPVASMAQQDNWYDVFLRGGDAAIDTSPVNENGNPIAVDTATRALTCITYPHHEKHNGKSFKAGIHDADLDTGETNGFVVIVANDLAWPHMIVSASTSLAAEGFVYRGASLSATGTPITVFNDDHNSTNVSATTVYMLTDSTVSAWGTLIDDHLFGATGAGNFRGAGGETGRNESIFKQNTIYIIMLIGQADDNRINIDANWYNHTNKTD